MGTVTHLGWSKPGDEIPMPVGLVMGKNLRKPEPAPSESKPFGWDLQEIAKWIEDQEK
jgi:hypothetical protein